MANKIQIFENPSFGEIRTAGTSEQPLFCLADICRVLEIKNVSDCKSRLDQRGIVLTDTPTKNQFGAEVIQQLVFINEKNLYRVIMRSDKPQAEPFQDWVCGEVLPSIRKTGSYSVQQQHKIPQSFSETLMLAAEQAQQRIIEAHKEKIPETFAFKRKGRIFAVRNKLKGGKVRKSLWAIFMPIKKHIRFHAPVSQVNAATAFEVLRNGSAWNRSLFPAKQAF